MTYQEKRILNNSIILKIYDDEVLNSVFRLLNKKPKDLYKYVQIVKKSLLILNDDEIFLVIKNFWSSIIKISKLPINDLQTKFSITKKTSLKIIFATWLEILEYSQNHNDKYTILDAEYFDKAAEFLCSPNENTIHTLASYIQPNDGKLEKRYPSLEFWRVSPKNKNKNKNKYEFTRISDFSSSDKVHRLINLIKFGLRCKKVSSKFVLNDIVLKIEEKDFEVYHYEFKDSNARVELNAIERHLLVCFFDKGFYEYSKSKNYFDFNECLRPTWSKFIPGYRWTPWGFEDNKIGFIQKDKNKRIEEKPIPNKQYKGNVDITNYKYIHELKDLELLIFSFHKASKKPYYSHKLGFEFKYKS